MSNARRARDALAALLVALAPFAYKQFVLGRTVVASVTVATMVGIGLAYRYADARALEHLASEADADELKPVLRRVGRYVRRRFSSND